MNFEKLNEPIEAIVHFNGKTIYLLKFKWKNRAYKVVKTVHKWTEREGQIKKVHFKSLADNSDLFEIVFNCETFEWKIVNVQLAV